MKHLDLATLETVMASIDNLAKTQRIKTDSGALKGVLAAWDEVEGLANEEKELRRQEYAR
ncbi:hypothetical protein [Lapidilactobacillus wuchangensis]|uniref:hypothetical protein n=1 Tax=Lapidilactobacillus wuchangensis TaxID=2486001 RepID=UPI000F771FAC|nr:hypothetical protein [Lapidilactobacillus wuchangensis]